MLYIECRMWIVDCRNRINGQQLTIHDRIKEEAMKGWRKSLTVAAIAGSSIAAYTVGTSLVKDVQFARAEEQVKASREQLAQVKDMADVFRAVGKAVEPSVVSIDVHKTVKGVSGRTL